jgi:hypothetical protein
VQEGKKEPAMNIFKFLLLASLGICVFGVLKAALFVYILFRPDSPPVGFALEADSRTGVTAKSAREAGITPISLSASWRKSDPSGIA